MLVAALYISRNIRRLGATQTRASLFQMIFRSGMTSLKSFKLWSITMSVWNTFPMLNKQKYIAELCCHLFVHFLCADLTNRSLVSYSCNQSIFSYFTDLFVLPQNKLIGLLSLSPVFQGCSVLLWYVSPVILSTWLTAIFTPCTPAAIENNDICMCLHHLNMCVHKHWYINILRQI